MASYPCSDDPQEIIESIVEAQDNADKFDKFVNGGVLEEVQLGAGQPTPTLRNLSHLVKSAAATLDGSDVSGKFSDAANGGETLRTLADRFGDIVNVKDFGAIGDGVADDTEAFRAALAAAQASESMIFVPSGEYLLTENFEGPFVGGTGSKTTRPVSMVRLDESQLGRLARMAFTGSLLFRVPFDITQNSYNFGRALQSFCYDKHSNVVYFIANYSGRGVYIYAIDYSTKEMLGNNVSSGAFYNVFPHQGFGLYRPAADDSPKFFCGANQYTTASGDPVPSELYKLHLVSWDYENPSVATVEKWWTMWDANIYAPLSTSLCVSPDGSTLCGKAKRISDGKYVFGVWEISDILSVSSGGSIISLATIIESPYGTNDIADQGLACDDRYLYCLWSNAEYSPHLIRVLDIASGNVVYDRNPSWEGGERWSKTTNDTLEAECLNWIPVKDGLHLCISVSSRDNEHTKVETSLYDLAEPFYILGDPFKTFIQTYPGYTETSSDLDIYTTTQRRYFTSGAVIDLYGGAAYLDVIANQYETNSRQILYRGNTPNDIRTRVRNDGVYTNWCKILCEDVNGYIKQPVVNLPPSEEVVAFIRNGNSDYRVVYQCTLDTFHNIYKGVSQVCFINNEETDGLSQDNGIHIDFADKVLRTSAGDWRLGTASAPWSLIYSSDGTVHSSDARLKSETEDLGDAVFRAWSKVRFKTFQWLNAIEKKGASARIHVGLYAQEIADAFASEGLDASRFGLFCYDEWEDRFEELEDGTKIKKQSAGNRYGIRYEEALALECAYQRWLGEQRDARIAVLEAKLAGEDQ